MKYAPERCEKLLPVAKVPCGRPKGHDGYCHRIPKLCLQCGRPVSAKRFSLCRLCEYKTRSSRIPVLTHVDSLPTHDLLQVIGPQVQECQWPLCELGEGFGETMTARGPVCEHLLRPECSHPPGRACRLCVRGVVHMKCNLRIAEFDWQARTFGVHPSWPSEVKAYLQFGAIDPIWLPERLAA